MNQEQVTVEYYADALSIRLIGAVNVPRGNTSSGASPLKGKAYEDAIRVGKVLCKVHGMNQMEAVVINEDGDEIDRITVFR